MPVSSVDGNPVALGPVTRQLADHYRTTVPNRLGT
jgi:hypothetical protein